MMPNGGFSREHLSHAGGASMVGHLQVVEIPTEDEVVRIKGGLIDLMPNLSSFARSAWSVYV